MKNKLRLSKISHIFYFPLCFLISSRDAASMLDTVSSISKFLTAHWEIFPYFLSY